MVGLAKVLLATSTEQTNLTKLRASVLGFSYDLCVPSGGVEEQRLPKTQKRFRSERFGPEKFKNDNFLVESSTIIL